MATKSPDGKESPFAVVSGVIVGLIAGLLIAHSAEATFWETMLVSGLGAFVGAMLGWSFRPVDHVDM